MENERELEIERERERSTQLESSAESDEYNRQITPSIPSFTPS